jgi:hypothetical protein
MEDLLADWMFRAGTADRVAPEWQAALKAEPHDEVLRQAGFDYDGKFEFTAEQTWNVESLIGFVYSTSVLNRRALGGLTETFEEDLARRVLAANPDAVFHQEASFAYELAHKL